ncbi:beta-lactamase family protein [Streptomyces rectiverticillatus]|uniref:serine hydrolase domain-containing protein n=1 Tax=Streptomyces rectiverticillatus TaxID=173860 RepID=UPI0015C3DD59|nr:serine hydrolase domain-containing protein [Streptomyces rectiverticillatus]QLE75644.1 beta-lactamase family protein [Streptomyces rectiverticillatus]
MRRPTAAISALLAATALVSAAVPAAAAPAGERGTDRETARGAATPAGEGKGAALQRALDGIVAEGVPGAIAEVREGDRVWRVGSGAADLRDGRPAKPGDRFRAGSVTKTFVATVVLQLADEGRLGLDEPIGRHLPGLVPDGDDGTPVTVRQLLGHTSGIPNYTDVLRRGDDPIRKLQHSRHTPRELVELALKEPRPFNPGQPGKWAYSNTNYVLLAMLIEKATGRTLDQEIGRRIVRPLHLTDTTVPASPRLAGRHLNGYERLPGETAPADFDFTGFTDFTDFSPTAFWGPGNIVSTTADLNRFYRALDGGKLLPSHLWQEMRTFRKTDRGPERMYGLGLESRAAYCPGEQPVWGHTGSVPGYGTFSFTSADGKRQITLAVNTSLTMPEKADTAALKVFTTALCAK